MLRVGVMLDSYTTSAWIAKAVEDIHSSGFARIEFVMLNAASAGISSPLKSSLLHYPNSIFFRLYERWDYLRNKVDRDAMALTDVSSLLAGVSSIGLHPDQDNSVDTIPEDELRETRKHDLDVILQFGFPTLHGGILGATRYGVWSFQFGGDREGNPSSPPLFWELFDRNPVSESTLRLLTDSPAGDRVVYRSHSSTDLTSLYRSRNPIYWKAANFAFRSLRDIHLHGIECIDSLPSHWLPDDSTHRISRTPGIFRMMLFMVRHVSRSVRARIASLRSGPAKKWCIAIRSKTAGLSFDDPSKYRLLLSPSDRFYADPFLVERNGKTFLFFEDFRFDEGRAIISCCELESDGAAGLPTEVLRRPYHLSYPFIFEEGGETYMIPESRENRLVELFRATDFPTKWTSEAILMSGVYAVDATIHKVDGKFWMFAGVSDGTYSTCDELCLFSADAVTGPWTPHPRNPVISDVRRARPAGALFYNQGRLIRPSQDSSKAYGYALVFSEIITLSETEYEERPVGRIEPDWARGNVGTHTYNQSEHFEAVDRDLPPKLQV